MRRLPGFPPLLGHQGGWDETLLIFGGPLVLFMVMRWLGSRRKGGEEPTEDEGNETRRDG